MDKVGATTVGGTRNLQEGSIAITWAIAECLFLSSRVTGGGFENLKFQEQRRTADVGNVIKILRN